jgi:hypothetical protein
MRDTAVTSQGSETYGVIRIKPMGRFRTIKLDADERLELDRIIKASARRAQAPAEPRPPGLAEADRAVEQLDHWAGFLIRIAKKRGLDPYRCTIATGWRGARVRYEP